MSRAKKKKTLLDFRIILGHEWCLLPCRYTPSYSGGKLIVTYPTMLGSYNILSANKSRCKFWSDLHCTNPREQTTAEVMVFTEWTKTSSAGMIHFLLEVQLNDNYSCSTIYSHVDSIWDGHDHLWFPLPFISLSRPNFYAWASVTYQCNRCPTRSSRQVQQ